MIDEYDFYVIEKLVCKHGDIYEINTWADIRKELEESQKTPTNSPQLAIALITRLDNAVKSGWTQLVAEEIINGIVNEWRSATDKRS